MEQYPLISIVIPIYNVEKFLPKCLNSVINQTYKNIEIICVNDCTQDSCLNIIESYIQKDKRIKLVNNKENIGLGLSRNAGINVANGKYVYCLDADDWLEIYAMETLVNLINEYGECDVIKFLNNAVNYKTEKIVAPIKIPQKYINKKMNIFDTPELLIYWNSCAWTKLINTEFIRKNNLYYNDYRCLEDIEYSMIMATKAKSIIYTNSVLLNYLTNRNNSLVTKSADFIYNVVTDTKTANIISKDFPLKTRNYLLRYMYNFLIANFLDVYYTGKISFNELKNVILENIDFSVLEEYQAYPATYYMLICNRIIKYSAFHFRISYSIRRFIKEHFVLFTKLYFYCKKIIRKVFAKD